MHFIHFGICAGHDHFKLIFETEVLQIVEYALQPCLPENQHSSLYRVERLGSVEAEHAQITKVGDRLVANFDAENVSSIVDKFQIVPPVQCRLMH